MRVERWYEISLNSLSAGTTTLARTRSRTRVACARARARAPRERTYDSDARCTFTRSSFPGFLSRGSNDVAPRIFGTVLGEESVLALSPPDVLHTRAGKAHTAAHSWHIWPHIQGRTINFARKRDLFVCYTGCVATIHPGRAITIFLYAP